MSLTDIIIEIEADTQPFEQSAAKLAMNMTDLTAIVVRFVRRYRFEHQYAKQRANRMRRVKKGRR